MTALAIPSEEKLMKDSVAIFDVVFHHIQNVSVANTTDTDSKPIF